MERRLRLSEEDRRVLLAGLELLPLHRPDLAATVPALASRLGGSVPGTRVGTMQTVPDSRGLEPTVPNGHGLEPGRELAGSPMPPSSSEQAGVQHGTLEASASVPAGPLTGIPHGTSLENVVLSKGSGTQERTDSESSLTGYHSEAMPVVSVPVPNPTVEHPVMVPSVKDPPVTVEPKQAGTCMFEDCNSPGVKWYVWTRQRLCEEHFRLLEWRENSRPVETGKKRRFR